MALGRSNWDWQDMIDSTYLSMFLKLAFPNAINSCSYGCAASDFLVIRQQDGSMKTHPWPLSFGISAIFNKGQRRVSVLINGSPRRDVTFILPMAGASGICNWLWSSGMYEVRWFLPSPEQLAALDLQEGRNSITFRNGIQEVTANVFLYDWNKRFVVVDVDGTITKSDVLGQLMSLVGKDWTHLGIAQLLSAIKANGYEVLYLSARSIFMADMTRTFLQLTQGDVQLPIGPVILAPDGPLFSLRREVWDKKPQEFKIPMLECLRGLFPRDGNSPFHGGFGNRETDRESYVSAGIPREKIFIINVKGEVNGAQTYASLHGDVGIHFPPLVHPIIAPRAIGRDIMALE